MATITHNGKHIQQEELFIGNKYKVVRAWTIGRCKMKIGDILSVYDIHYGLACNGLWFKNNRLPRRNFATATWLFESSTELINQ